MSITASTPSSPEAWLHSPEHQRVRFFGLLAVASFGLSLLLLALMVILWWPFRGFYFYDVSGEVVSRLSPFFLPTLIFLLAGGFLLTSRNGQRAKFDARQRQLDHDVEIVSRQAELIAQGDPQHAEIWALTNERLRGYHERAYRQADQSFRNAQWAIFGGFIIVAGTAAIAAWKTTLSTSSSIVLGVIGTVGAGLAAYIGRTFLRLQETTANHMRSYFDQPQETFRYLLAERLVSRLPEAQRTQSVEHLVQAVMLSGFSVEQARSALSSPATESTAQESEPRSES
ncbi:TRADD-N-associated membrane domain-containing protein [Streptacidiphilus sp. PAMC 29251]